MKTLLTVGYALLVGCGVGVKVQTLFDAPEDQFLQVYWTLDGLEGAEACEADGARSVELEAVDAQDRVVASSRAPCDQSVTSVSLPSGTYTARVTVTRSDLLRRTMTTVVPDVRLRPGMDTALAMDLK